MTNKSGTKTILILGIALLFFSTLFPPWVLFTVGKSGGTELPLGFSFLFTTPEPHASGVHMRVDFIRLIIDWVVLFLWVILALLMRKSAEVDEEEE